MTKFKILDLYAEGCS